MSRITILIVLIMNVSAISAQERPGNGQIFLLVRGDDIGSTHAANVGCIESYKNGIVRSVELMPVCPWFLEAAEMLNQNPDLDVGIHLALTSEWSLYKWRPLTACASLVDTDGYFFPMVWKNRNFPPNNSIQESAWKIGEIEQELRAQIELALKHVPHISHLGGHMGFGGLDPKIEQLLKSLAKEYDLEVDLKKSGVKRFSGWRDAKTHEDWIDAFCRNLEALTPGRYLFIEHPARNHPEMQSIGHVGNKDVAIDREWVTRVFVSDKVKRTIKSKGIKLISYRDLRLGTSTMPERTIRSDQEWKKLLTPEQYNVLREKGTELPFRNKFDEHFEPGTYSCAACGNPLFTSQTKFNSGCGWPAFYAAQAGDRVKLTPDHSHGRTRTEVTCARCDSHLGHIFDDAPQTPTGQRYCINSVSLRFTPAEKQTETNSD